MACTSSPTLILNRNANKLHHFPWLPERKPLQTTINLNLPSFPPRGNAIFVRSSSSAPPSLSSDVLTNDEDIEKIKRLQNGSDIRGVAMEGEKGRTVDLTPPAVEAIAESFGEWLISKLRDGEEEEVVDVVKVSLGRDPRVTGAVLSVGVFAGLARAGCLGFDMGLATTPACFMSTVLPDFSYHGSIMMTASHLPYNRNGLKFFTKRGGLTSLEVEELCDRAARKYANRQAKVSLTLNNPPKKVNLMSAYANHLRDIIKERINHPTHYDTPLQGFQVEELCDRAARKYANRQAKVSLTLNNPPKKVNLMSAYANHLRDIIKERINHPTHYDTPLQGFQIIVNAGNGSGGFFTYDVLDKLGADTFGSLHLNPDGMFPNHIPNPEDETAMAFTRAAVLENSADIGIVFDTDVDRSGLVDDKGNPINGDKLIALMSAIVLKDHPETTIVTDARTSIGLSRFITNRGGKHCLYRVGYRNVIDKGVQLNKDGIETHLMMETSGHGALKENCFLDDGAYMVVKIIIEMVRMRLLGSSEGIGSLIEDLEDPVDSVELRMDVLSEPRYAKAKAVEVIETFRKYVEDDKIEGWVLDSCGDCWVGEGCLVDLNENPTAIDAHMYRVKVLDKEENEQGWVHLRQSVHNPNIALNMQSSIPGGCRSMTKIFMDKYETLIS